MKSFETITSIATPLLRVNVDTDQIVPKQFLKLIQRTGFGKFLFYDWRFNSNEKPNDEFILNDQKYKNSKILLAGENFGCGSSREHAAWALKDYGFDVIIAPSFADIFYNNCFKNGILPIILDSLSIQKLLAYDDQLTVDLKQQTITLGTNSLSFQIESHRKKTLMEGLDDIAVTLQYMEKINEYEQEKPHDIISKKTL